MIKILETNAKEWFLDKFKRSKYLDDLKAVKSDKISLIALPADELRSYEQNRAVHALIGELYKSGLSSFDDYNTCRDFFKEKAGLIQYDKAFLDPVMRNIQLKVYQALPTPELKFKHQETILKGQRVVRSTAEATKEEMTLMIEEVINYCYEVGLNSVKFNEIMEGLNKYQNEFDNNSN